MENPRFDKHLPHSVRTADGSVELTPDGVSIASTRKYQDKLMWRAKYKGGMSISQYDNIGNEYSVSKLPREDLRQFVLIDKKGNERFVLELKPGDRFVYRRRTILKVSTGETIVIHIMGHQLPTEDNDRTFYFVHEDKFMVYCGPFVDGHLNKYDDDNKFGKTMITAIEAEEAVIT